MHCRRMTGGSHSHLIMGSDSIPYIVKFLDNPQHQCVLANEWLAAHLAALLDLPVPRSAIVEVSEAFLRANPQLTINHQERERSPAAGLQFGSELVGGILPGRNVDYLPTSRWSLLSNRMDLFGALVLDRWICNRDGRQTVFVTNMRTKKIRVYLIDHGDCFGRSTWELDIPVKCGLYRNHSVYKDVLGLRSFEPWLTRLNGLNIEAIWKGFTTMPAAWYESSPVHPEVLTCALEERRQRIADVLTDMAHQNPRIFPNWE